MPVPTAASSAGFAFSHDPLPVFNVLPGAFLLLSPALVIEAVSNAFLTETLTTRADVVGRSLFDVFPDNPKAPDAHAVSSMRGALLRVLATGKAGELPRQRYDVPDPARPGRFVERHWQPCNTPVLDAEGRVTHILHEAVDVTERVRAEARLGESRAREQSANADADALRLRLRNILMELPANVAAHHGPDHVFGFVNPHYQALFPARALRGRAVREALPELVGQGFFRHLDHVYQTGEPFYGTEMETWADFTHTGQLDRRYRSVFFQAPRDDNGVIDGGLNFSCDVTELVVGRIEEGKIEARPVDLALATLVHDTVAEMRGLRKAGQTIDWQVECPIPVRPDAALPRKMLMNLLSNALKCSGENAVVTVRASCRPRELTVSVRDQGMGIAEEDQTPLFKQFYRARNVSTLAGTGLRLYIVAKYLELMGGTIDLRSAPDHGTTIRVFLTTPD